MSTSAIDADADVLVHAIRARIAGFRRARGLTFDQLATLSGVSKGTLVQIEQGKTNPSIAILCRVASALRVSVAELVEMPDRERTPVQVLAPGAARKLWSGPRGGSAVLLAGTDGPDMLELWQWELLPGERYVAHAHGKGTCEVLHVIQGTLLLEVDGTAHALEAGASALAWTDKTHAYACSGKKSVQFTMVVFEPGQLVGRNTGRDI